MNGPLYRAELLTIAILPSLVLSQVDLKLNLITSPVTSPSFILSPKRSTLSLRSQIPEKRFESVDCKANVTPRPIIPERVSEEKSEVKPKL